MGFLEKQHHSTLAFVLFRFAHVKKSVETNVVTWADHVQSHGTVQGCKQHALLHAPDAALPPISAVEHTHGAHVSLHSGHQCAGSCWVNSHPTHTCQWLHDIKPPQQAVLAGCCPRVKHYVVSYTAPRSVLTPCVSSSLHNSACRARPEWCQALLVVSHFKALTQPHPQPTVPHGQGTNQGMYTSTDAHKHVYIVYVHMPKLQG